MIPDPAAVARDISDALASQNPLLTALDAAQRRADETTAQVKATQAALSDLEADAQVEALESGAKNEDGRKAAARAWLKTCAPYNALKLQLAEEQRALREAQANRDDCERRLKSADKSLVALVALAEMCALEYERDTARIKLEGHRLYRQGGADIRAAAEAQLAARQGAQRG